MYQKSLDSAITNEKFQISLTQPIIKNPCCFAILANASKIKNYNQLNYQNKKNCSADTSPLLLLYASYIMPTTYNGIPSPAHHPLQISGCSVDSTPPCEEADPLQLICSNAWYPPSPQPVETFFPSIWGKSFPNTQWLLVWQIYEEIINKLVKSFYTLQWISKQDNRVKYVISWNISTVIYFE